ncbi:tRNA (N6-threonylcarbamoyladenosine(37)-N6)-methyltransferase TrmO [Ruminococcus sp.]|uniref:tRNA (N6-threonylcarbamoyladenosine(37)-N6)-methyltransferase TrmO n=1 Tax=Ruminococcus sp. TaxID=41978 RepID=UPI0025D58DA7|nr:tRNA (N6-threonylcarbamoyladenosine(37)-N6)-methyltransferase TrmO [Ruminococcus sp.]MBQ8966668.1 tRNA (N6-threonylcarbamoyladenosine(37)-N6)-methyltransferase TrmO [Ruminococcus sp.]
MEVIAKIHTDLPAKFGLPRQSGLVEELEGLIIFEPEYRVPEALRGMEGFSHLWLIWEFSEAKRESWSPTVRPPRLGGNVRMGVFATRSPFRPNPIGLSCVKLLGIEDTPDSGLALRVGGVDLMDGTPIYDIKPYLPLADSRPEATGGFASERADYSVEVDFPEVLLEKVPKEKRQALKALLAQDPRPAYQQDPDRVYGFGYAGLEVKFTVKDGVLHVADIETVK